ncbi:hypothetical protein [Paenarthrobacter sp. PH39-S1]|uniref:hypothetical protein n=1 Tax=Paenarthrobacter sp. PH39-S1 TaxID=3046204 RepID=UPI0024BB2F87|nr:hypothetical protein [Paenarthrobacter sp. PH39-S1]MDJ0356345.1 hypothetical protein [Paenarthrobacter sp. PH39-S1]
MHAIAELMPYVARRRRLWLSLLVTVVLVAAIAVVFAARTPSPAKSALPAPTATTASPKMPASGPSFVAVVPSQKPELPLATNEPNTTNYRMLAQAAAEAIYTWDARSSTYSEVYERLRSWWDVLPDGSNPLTVMAQEFQATGVTPASFAALSGMHAYRTASVSTSSCDEQLTQVQQQPAPWAGLHACTFTLKVEEHQTGGKNAYTVPVSVMVNCPPASTAPADRCAMVAFYASADRIVY